MQVLRWRPDKTSGTSIPHTDRAQWTADSPDSAGLNFDTNSTCINLGYFNDVWFNQVAEL
jgi:hypothetical protein